MKSKITVHADGSVTLSHDDLYGSGERVSTTYYVVAGGKYVRQNGGHQVCEKLANRGVTLISTVAGLPDLIRSEWRKCRQSALDDRSSL